jgi:alkylation response protein AidB-like acyl-CoA dehydrogenase
MTAPFDTSEAIAMIRRSAEGVADRRDLSRIRRLRYSRPGFERSAWTTMCELGWPALRLPESCGGVGLDAIAYCALAESLGAALTPEPLIGATICSALLDADALGPHLTGASLVLPAWQDTRDAAGPTANVRLENGKLFGDKRYVPMAAGADAFLVVGPEVSWLVDARAPGVSVELLDTQDGGHFGAIQLDGASGRKLEIDPGFAMAEACLATSAYLLGLAGAALERTLEYLRLRVQFGKVIGSFQALQHRAVELKLQLELTRASVEDAAARWDLAPGTDLSFAAISRAKARSTGAAMFVTRQAIQLHGGIGFTDEHDIGLFLRKAMVVAPQFGGVAFHRARFADLVVANEGG